MNEIYNNYKKKGVNMAIFSTFLNYMPKYQEKPTKRIVKLILCDYFLKKNSISDFAFSRLSEP